MILGKSYQIRDYRGQLQIRISNNITNCNAAWQTSYIKLYNWIFRLLQTEQILSSNRVIFETHFFHLAGFIYVPEIKEELALCKLLYFSKIKIPEQVPLCDYHDGICSFCGFIGVLAIGYFRKFFLPRPLPPDHRPLFCSLPLEVF